MWRNGRRKGLKIPRGGPVPVRVRSQAPLTEVSPFWRKYMRPLLCLIFFRSFGSLPPPCCDRTVRNSDAHALCRRRDKASPVGVRYSGRSRGLSQMRQVVPYRRSLFRRSATALQARLEAIRKREFGTSATPFFSARPTPSLSTPFMSPENEIVGTRRRKQCRSLQVAIGCFREKVYYTLSESRALSSPIGNRYSVATLRFAPYESGHKHQRFKLGLKRSENGSLAQVPLPFFGSPYAIAFRSVYVTGERNSDAIAPRYSRISPSPIGNRYSVATLRFAPYGPVTSTSASSSA